MSVQRLANHDAIDGAVSGGQQESPTLVGHRGAVQRPLFILAAPRSFTSVVCAMLGQHPQMYGLPELHLFGAETIGEWWEICERTRPAMPHGALRAVAELFYGKQTEHTITLAGGWLRRRSHYTTGFLLESLAERVHPRFVVEKSPGTVLRPEFLRRAYRMFPDARFIHLVRHPRGQGESVLKFIDNASRTGRVPKWLLHLAKGAPRSKLRHSRGLDPQRGWYQRNLNICEFLELVPADQKMRMRGEDILTDPGRHLQEIAGWLDVRTDAQAIEEMKHPERSPYACFGPKNARAGNDPCFSRDPVLRSVQLKRQSIEGPLNWRSGDFLPKVKRLAREFGYQ